MFDGFQRRHDGARSRRFAVSTGATVVAYVAIGSAVLWAAQRTVHVEEDPEVAVKFKTPEVEPPKPKAPPPAPAPIIPEGMKVKRTHTARPAPSMVAPKQISDKKLEEGKPGDAVEVGDGGGSEEGTGTGPAAPEPVHVPPPPPPPPPKHAEPINLPEGAEPPVPDEGNVTPEFPEAMRSAGKQGLVILKIVVTEKGNVGKIEVMRGEEPFIAAALAAVKTWKFSPALVEGKPTSVVRVFKIPFVIKT